MPFGTEILVPGVRFRLWAPGARNVALGLGSDPLRPMKAGGDGWFHCDVREAREGQRYRFRIDGGLDVPDPASRFNPDDVHGPSEIVDPLAFGWTDDDWRGRPWPEAVLYELHVGTFSPAGTFAGVEARLDHLVRLGVTAIELMPVADFPGRRNWGYDGVLPFAPDASYGRPEDLKRLVQAAHARGLMVILDVVYNHFGPEGNYLHAYAPAFFNPEHETPWGAAINFDARGSEVVRRFVIDNALHWLEEYHFDGLRLDAVHAFRDDSTPDIVEALTTAVRTGPGRDRHVHLILENDRNQSRYLRRDASGHPRHATAQWNDDVHHACHVIATGETDGYYADYAADPVAQLARCLAEGFAYQGEASVFRGGELRGEPSADLTPLAFVNFLQTHDQVGNRAFGERLCRLARPEALDVLTATVLLAPGVPMLFMGEEFAAATPFLFFCDFGHDLADAVREGRRREFARFTRFADPASRESIPDPNLAATFETSRLDWSCLEHEPHRTWLARHASLLATRARWLVPRLAAVTGGHGCWQREGRHGMRVTWTLGDGSRLTHLANLGDSPLSVAPPPAAGRTLHAVRVDDDAIVAGRLPPWSLAVRLDEGDA
ncbi:MAG: malto-oligosyltrehalose trehalohydrolase [Betaproteobacteria bacterium]|nr:malto-oligosyltrehalose trehalohydrolase [Betaproteobacteria bacterium]